jgi:hypothetical protein
MVKRLDRSEVGAETDEAAEAFIESDFRIRSGQCPNKCGRLSPSTDDVGQVCPGCGFSTNVSPDREVMS